jgi:pimeloyl-ACP methyl ester carboxylesterase
MPRKTSVLSELQHDVILLPGGVLPAGLAYGALLDALADAVDPVVKELEVYADAEPPPSYTLAVEVEGILRTAEAAGFDRFHLVGYSAGGASSLLFAASHPDRLRSLALIEPAWAGNEGLDPAEVAARRALERIRTLPPAQLMPAFVRAQLRPGVEPPRPGPDRCRGGWRNARPVFGPSRPRSAPASSTWTRFAAFGVRSILRSAASVTRTTTAGWRCAWPVCFRTSRSRRSRTATTSIRRTEPSPSG